MGTDQFALQHALQHALGQPLNALYIDHHRWLQDWLRHRLRNAADAADLMHDTFERLLKRPQIFDSSEEARAWLCTVASGLCIDLWRRREVERAWLDALAAQPQGHAPSAEQQAAVLQALREIDAMLHQLPPKCARAFILAGACGMTHQEVAREVGVSTRMVGHYVSRAMLHCMQLEARKLAQTGANGW